MKGAEKAVEPFDPVRLVRALVRLRLWSRGLARCNHCARMTRQEWETMCDCWLADVAWWRRFVR